MTSDSDSGTGDGLLRERDADATEVTPIELFFDLVYVLAITQITHHLLSHLSLRGVGETLVLLLAVWGVWIHIAWTTNYFDLSARLVRLALLGVMLASLVLSASLPTAFAERGLAVAVAIIVILAGWTLFLLAAIEPDHHLRPVFRRVLFWEVGVGGLFLTGGLMDGEAKLTLWAAAVAVIYVAMWMGFPVPGRGRNRTTDYTIYGAHMAQRCFLFIIIALGESILITGATAGQLPASDGTIAAFVVAFAGSAVLWWLYFDRAEGAGREVIAAAADPGRLGLLAYTYGHIPIVAGIIATAAADEVTMAHPNAPSTVTSTALILGGPALYLAGLSLFKWILWDIVPWTRLAAIAALVALVPLSAVTSALALSVAATLVLIALALWDVLRPPGQRHDPQTETGPRPRRDHGDRA